MKWEIYKMAFKKRMDDPKYHIVLKMIKKEWYNVVFIIQWIWKQWKKNINIKYYVSGIE